MQIYSENYAKDINKPKLCGKKRRNCFNIQTGCVLRNTAEHVNHLKFKTRNFHSAGCDGCQLWRSERIAGSALIGADINMQHYYYYHYYYYYITAGMGHAAAQLVVALCYMPEGRGFDS
jgi:hypothetical protein